jgi:hypothetical protein
LAPHFDFRWKRSNREAVELRLLFSRPLSVSHGRFEKVLQEL